MSHVFVCTWAYALRSSVGTPLGTPRASLKLEGRVCVQVGIRFVDVL